MSCGCHSDATFSVQRSCLKSEPGFACILSNEQEPTFKALPQASSGPTQQRVSGFPPHRKLKSTRLTCGRDTETPVCRLSFEEMTQWSLSLEKLLSSKCRLQSFTDQVPVGRRLTALCPVHLDGIKVFQAFLKCEFSDENIEFWLVCEDYKKIKSSFRLSSRARKIFKRYIQADAAREVERRRRAPSSAMLQSASANSVSSRRSTSTTRPET